MSSDVLVAREILADEAARVLPQSENAGSEDYGRLTRCRNSARPGRPPTVGKERRGVASGSANWTGNSVKSRGAVAG